MSLASLFPRSSRSPSPTPSPPASPSAAADVVPPPRDGAGDPNDLGGCAARVRYFASGAPPLVEYAAEAEAFAGPSYGPSDGRPRLGDVPQTAAALDTAVNGHTPHYDVVLDLDVRNGCGGRIWPSARVLGQFLAGPASPIRSSGEAGAWGRGKHVVELGSGTGLLGFLAAKLAPEATVYVTDQDVMLSLLHQNHQLDAAALPNAVVAECDWGTPIAAPLPPKADVLLLADCVYLETAFAPLIETMRELSRPDTEIWFSYQQRRKADKRFFLQLKKHFTWDEALEPAQARAVAPARLFKMRLRDEGKQ